MSKLQNAYLTWTGFFAITLAAILSILKSAAAALFLGYLPETRSGLSPAQEYDAGLSDVRPSGGASAELPLPFSKQLDAMLNRRI